MKRKMQEKLTKEDVDIIKYYLRQRYIISLLIFLIISVIAFVEVVENGFGFLSILIVTTSLIVSYLIFYLLNSKYLSDLSNGTKIIKKYTIEKKILKEDKHSASLEKGTKQKESNTYKRFYIIFNNRRYGVDKEFYMECMVGDKVHLHMCPKSKLALYFHLEKTRNSNLIDPSFLK